MTATRIGIMVGIAALLLVIVFATSVMANLGREAVNAGLVP